MMGEDWDIGSENEKKVQCEWRKQQIGQSNEWEKEKYEFTNACA